MIAVAMPFFPPRQRPPARPRRRRDHEQIGRLSRPHRLDRCHSLDLAVMGIAWWIDPSKSAASEVSDHAPGDVSRGLAPTTATDPAQTASRRRSVDIDHPDPSDSSLPSGSYALTIAENFSERLPRAFIRGCILAWRAHLYQQRLSLNDISWRMREGQGKSSQR